MPEWATCGPCFRFLFLSQRLRPTNYYGRPGRWATVALAAGRCGSVGSPAAIGVGARQAPSQASPDNDSSQSVATQRRPLRSTTVFVVDRS